MKIAKLSLVAAVAVAGLSTANAQALEDAIKNVETSGSVVYRYNDYNKDLKDDQNSTTSNNYKAAINLSSKVNDDVKANTRFLVASGTGDFASLDTQTTGDSNVDVELSNVYFTYTGITNTTVNVGKQGLTTPWTVAIDPAGNEQTGTGILALSTQGPVTLAAAYFNQTNLGTSGNGLPGILNADKPVKDEFGAETDAAYDARVSRWNSTNDTNANEIGSSNVATIGAIANVGPVTVDAWYLDLQDTFDTYTLGAKAGFDVAGVKLGADARYTTLTLDDAVAEALDIDEDNSLAKITLTAKAGIVGAKLAYAKTDKDGGLVALDNDAVTNIQGWSVSANGKADADFYQAVVDADVLPNVNVSANYVTVDYVDGEADVDEQEVYGQLSYKMSKNLLTYVRYGKYTADETENGDKTDTIDETRGRVHVQYTF